MISRRTLLKVGALVAAMPEGLAAVETCLPQNYSYQGFPETLPHARKTFRFRALAGSQRPLWSRMSEEKRLQYVTAIKEAYCVLIRRSIRSPLHPGGLIGQSWIHFKACMDGRIHGNSAFLPWHRAFLFFHERLLQAALRMPSFRLAVWDWENGTQVPPIFDDWLKIPTVDGQVLDCQLLAQDRVARIERPDIQAWLLSHAFVDFAGGPRTARPRSATMIHSSVHSQLGGLMSDPQGSALHPIFYMHHANVDRYWGAWWDSYGEIDGFEPQWVKGPMVFYDVREGWVNVYPDGLMKTEPLGYCYEKPPGSFYQLTNIVAVPNADTVSVNPNAFFPLMNRMAPLVPSAQPSPVMSVAGSIAGIVAGAGKVGELAKDFVATGAFPAPPQMFKLLSSVVSAFPKLSLPVQLQLQVSGMRPGVYYPLLVGSLPIGGVSIFGEHHAAGAVDVLAAGTLNLLDALPMFGSAITPGLQISIGKPADGTDAPVVTNVLDCRILHPALHGAAGPIDDTTLKRDLNIS